MIVDDREYPVRTPPREAGRAHHQACDDATLYIECVLGHFVYVGGIDDIRVGDQHVGAGGKQTRRGGRVAGVPADYCADSGRHQHDRGEAFLVFELPGPERENRLRCVAAGEPAAREQAGFAVIMTVDGMGYDEA